MRISQDYPLISILITCYNRDKYLSEAIESVIRSTYENWELIIVDDGSKDRSVEIAEEYKKKDARIRVFVNDRNLGDYRNRNKAAEYARGKYLKFVDADDMIYPFGLEQMVYNMEQFPESGYGLCSIDKDHRRIFPYLLSPGEAYQKHYFDYPIFNRAPLSSIIKKDIFDSVNGFNEKRYTSDFDMWHKISLKYPVVLMPHGIVWYRRHENQEISNYKAKPEIALSYFLISEYYLNHTDCPMEKTEKDRALKNVKHKISRYVFFVFRKHGVKKGIKMIRQSNKSTFDLLHFFFDNPKSYGKETLRHVYSD